MISSHKGFDMEGNIKVTTLLAKNLLNNISNMDRGWKGKQRLEEDGGEDDSDSERGGEAGDEKFAEEDEIGRAHV